MRITTISIGLLVLLAVLTVIADDPKSILWEDTGSFKHIDRSSAHELSRQLLLHHRNRFRIASAPSAASLDAGDVAVIVDNGAILIPPADPHLIDLAVPTNIMWTPTATGFSVALAGASFDPNIGGVLPLSDDDTENVPLPFSFPFLGSTYGSIFVNSDGNITLGAADPAPPVRDAAHLIGGPPRIAPLFNDLNPEAGGSVSARVATDHAVVTWTNVPEFGSTLALNTFQVTLHLNGTITYSYSQIRTRLNQMVIGVAKGNNAGPFNEIDLTADLPGSFDAGAIFEEFAPAHGTLIAAVALTREFYRTHADKYDFLVFFTDFDVDLQVGFAFHLGVKNETTGLGTPIVDMTSTYSSAGELESLVFMNHVGLYWPDEGKLVDPPIQMFRFAGGASPNFSPLGPPGSEHLSRRARRMGTLHPGDTVSALFAKDGAYTIGLNSPMSVMAQEVGHRWLAFVPFVHPTKGIGPDSFDLLGRGLAHWSFFFNVRVPQNQFGGDPRASSAEGNAIIDFGGNVFGDCVNPGQTRFRTEGNELIDGYTLLDQYLMGLRQASEVGPFWYIDEPTTPVAGASFEAIRSRDALDDVGVCGKRVDLTLANIQSYPGVGPRVPAIGDEIDRDPTGAPKPDVKTMAFVLLVQQGTQSHAAAISQVDNFRRTWKTYGNGPATAGRGRFDTSLNPMIY